MSREEFYALTFPEFEALEERRAVEIRHARHDAAFIVATLFNVNRGSAVSPFDFLPGFERDPGEVEAEERRRGIVRSIRQAFVNKPGASAQKVSEMRGKIIARLQAQGHTDAEEMMTEAFPNL